MVRRGLALLVSVAIGWPAAPGAMQVIVDRDAIEQALSIGRTRLGVERSRFHDPYRIVVGKAPVDIVHVVTPFRRVVLAADERARLGGAGFGQRDALETLANAADQLDLYIELTFHPMNTYVGVPPYDVALLAPGTTLRIEPKTFDRFARYGPRVEGALLPLSGTGTLTLPRGSQPLLGATVVARFDTGPLDPNGTYDMVIGEAGKELGRAKLDLSKMR
jgi:hypothetical protein